MKELRKLNSNDVRLLCIRHNYYTKGNNEQYGNLLESIYQNEMFNTTTHDIVRIATDILEHSNLDYNMGSKNDYLKNIAFELFEICHTFLEFN